MYSESPDYDDELVRMERDLYRRLLDLSSQTELEPFLKDALALVVSIVSAKQGYLELRDDQAGREEMHWSISHGFSEEEVSVVQEHVSSGIIAEAMSTGRVIHTPTAFLDPRFLDRESVQVHHIQEVLCVPVGEDPPLGVLYLQRDGKPESFSEEHRSQCVLFCRHLVV